MATTRRSSPTPRPARAARVRGVRRARPGGAADAPRSAHGDWAPAADRPDPVAVLAAQAASRVQELVPIRYGRMLVSPFTFYRGAAAVMAADLAATPDSGIVVQACGDAHISNFGGFAAPDRRLVFGPNDFDETLPGPWEWDVKRMAASVEIAGRDVGLPGRPAAADRDGLRARVPRGDARLREREPSRRLVRPPHGERARRPLRREARREGPDLVRQAVRQGAAQDEPARGQEAHRAGRRRAALPQRAAAAGPVPRAVRAGRGARRGRPTSSELLDEYAASLDPDRRYLFGTYRFVDMARKVVGVGSVGTRAWVFLLVGREGKDPLVLQAKEAQASVLEPYLGASEFENHGERVVRGQRISHAASDIFLSWQRSEGLDGEEHDFYVRQLWDWKASVDLSTHQRVGSARLHASLRVVAGALARPLRRSARDRRLPGRRLELRRGDRPLLSGVRRSERAATTSGWPRPSPPATSSPSSASERVSRRARCGGRSPPARGG